jgi:mannose-6-phosphate isomerase-like protein (cupin superfamily)
MPIRRVVTVKNKNGKSMVALDGPSPAERALKHTPGFVSRPMWFTRAPTRMSSDRSDAALGTKTLLPGPGESSFMVVTFPPDSVFGGPDFNPALSGAEFLEAVPGIADRMEPDNPGMHSTPTVDYGIVLDGEVWLELDDGETVHLKQHDVVVQNGARHAWRNKGNKPVTMAFVLVGAQT